MQTSQAASHEGRTEPRHDVHHRARATAPDGRSISLVVVNISANGLMARSESDYEAGDRLQVQLPVVGAVTAHIRWALGGRLGCQLDRAIPAHSFPAVLGSMSPAR